MRIHGIVGRSGRKPGPTTTRPATVAPDIPDLVRRDFDVDTPDTVWCTDLTYVPTADGWLYLVTIIDAASRRIVGRAMADHMRTELMLDALALALATRDPDAGLIVHSDRGAQYTSQAWLDALDDVGALASMGRVGWCWDNALAEAWFARSRTNWSTRSGSSTTTRRRQRRSTATSDGTTPNGATRRWTTSPQTPGNEQIP